MREPASVIDYGAGNIGNVRRSLDVLNIPYVVTATVQDLTEGTIILPGVGAHGAAMEQMARSGLSDAIRLRAAQGQSILGICLGLQLMFTSSEESANRPGLGLISGDVRRLRSGRRPLPHLGWSKLERSNLHCYFAHSYRCDPHDESLVTDWARWGERFPAMVESGNMRGTQFHPERSGTDGLMLLDALLRGSA